MSGKSERKTTCNTPRALITVPFLSHDITVHDFVPENKHLVSDFCSHALLELTIVLHGEALLSIKESQNTTCTVFPLKEGDVLFINSGLLHKITAEPDSRFQSCLFLFSVNPSIPDSRITKEWVEDEKALIGTLLSIPFRITSDQRSFTCSRTFIPVIEESIASHRIGEMVIIRNHVSTILMTAFQSLTRLPQRSDFEKTSQFTSSLSVSMIMDYINSHYSEDITLLSMSADLYYSPRQCQRILRSNLGISFIQLVTDIRLANAKRLLRDTELSVQKIAEMCGFPSARKMSSVFRSQANMSPSSFRAAYSKRLQNKSRET